MKKYGFECIGSTFGSDEVANHIPVIRRLTRVENRLHGSAHNYMSEVFG